jgi:transcriptional regulator with PAS, ATPase and Fis domain
MPSQPDPDTLSTTRADDRTKRGPSQDVTYHPFLFVVLECDRPHSGGARYSLSGIREVAIERGRQREAVREETGRLRVRVPSPFISSLHAKLLWDGKDWTFEDTGSKNGSFINGSQIKEKVILTDEDWLEVGRTFFRFRKAVPKPPEVPEDMDSAHSQLLTGMATLIPDQHQALAELTRSIANSDLSVLLLGETGTGKEVLARAIHELSNRSKKPFVAVNCGAIPENLLEDALFGHIKGAFHGADRERKGYVQEAHGGTLFLDEIGDLPTSKQAVLLRVLQEKEVVQVGSTRPIRVDARFIAATHRPLSQMAEHNEFRQDLLARLEGFTHSLPNLRSRKEDLGLLIANILRRENAGHDLKLTPEAGWAMITYDWLHNVRELEQCLKRASAIVMYGGDPIDREHLSLSLSLPNAMSHQALPLPPAKDEWSREELIELLRQHGGAIQSVARKMGKSRQTLYEWMKKFCINPEDFRHKNP